MISGRPKATRQQAAAARASAVLACQTFRELRARVAATRLWLHAHAGLHGHVRTISGGAGEHGGKRAPETRVVLVVDDHDDTRDMYVQFLEAMGLRTVEATTCAEARARTLADGIDAVVLDRRLPDGDGGDVCRALKADPRTRALPVIVLSGRPADESLGADAYLMKPVVPDDLLQLIDRLVPPR
jgi:CheY-like chemotaxis protein